MYQEAEIEIELICCENVSCLLTSAAVIELCTAGCISIWAVTGREGLLHVHLFSLLNYFVEYTITILLPIVLMMPNILDQQNYQARFSSSSVLS